MPFQFDEIVPPAPLRRLLTLLLVAGLGAWFAPGDAGAMPPPAPGNTDGLPPAVREMIRQNPDLFTIDKGFRPVIKRQKQQRQAVIRDLIKQGYTLQEAQSASLTRVTTTRYCPVLCGLYADKITPDWPVGDLTDELFSLDYGDTNSLGHPGSMREHYLDMSYGTFDVQGGVFGWYGLPQNASFYYGSENGLTVDAADGETGAFLRHTLQAADAGVDFRIYDNDGPDNIPDSGDDDGYADLVMFVHPNEGGECGGSDIWSHSFVYSGWTQNPGPYETDDIGANGQPIKVEDYVIMPAVSCSGGRIEIGVFSHEFGHALGLPDLYDRTAYDPAGVVSTGGIGLYGLMAAGSYGGDYGHPETPTQMCAWSKEELGWLAPREVICDESATLYYQGDAPEAVKLWAGGDYSQDEWFLIENRRRKKWDRYLLGEGLLITHIDNNVLTQNDEACPGGNPCLAGHYQVMVIEADGQWEMQAAAAPVLGPWFGEAEDFFRAGGNDTWTDLTNPSSRDHAGGLTGISMTNVSAAGDKMTADFSVGQTCQSAPSLTVTASRITGGCDLDGFLDPGETVSLAVSARNLPTAAPATGIAATLVSLTPGVTVPGPATTFPDLGRGKFGDVVIPFAVHADTAAACSTLASFRIEFTADGGYAASETLSVRVGIDSLYAPFALFEDDMESGDENGWRHYAYFNEDDWSHNTNANHTTGAIPGTSWFTEAPATGKDVSLEPPAFIPAAGSVITFWHKYDTEDDWDGCVLELSVDGGATWIDVGDSTDLGYDDAVMVNQQSPISGRRCWNGLNASYPLFDAVNLNLAPWAGQTCRLRFRLGTDLAATGVLTPGWNIDDYAITDAQILREACETTPACSSQETDPPVFAGLASATNINAPACDAVDLKWAAADDASDPVTYLIYTDTTTPVSTASPAHATTALKYRATGLTPNQTYYFLVRARDSQGNIDANIVEQSVTLACEAPQIGIAAYSLTESDGCDGDDQPDGGEAMRLAVTLRNLGGTDARNVQAVLHSLSSRLIVFQDAADYGDLNAAYFEEGDAPFEFIVSPTATCQEPATLAVDITADGGYAVTETIDLVLETDVAFQPEQFFDDMEGAEPNGFSHYAESGVDDWGYVTTDAYSPTHAWFHPDAGGVTTAALVTPGFYVSATTVLSFRHKYVLEDPYDGAVLEISVDDGATWDDIGQSYNSSQDVRGPLFGSTFAPGRPFWSGSSGGFVLETVNLGAMTDVLGEPLYEGQTVRVRWLIGCDDSNTNPPFEGWWIDDVSITDTGTFQVSCDATTGCSTTLGVGTDAPGPLALAQNRPNPVRRSGTVIEYQISGDASGPVVLQVFDVAGRAVRTLVDAPRSAGTYRVAWDARTDRGEPLPEGVYFYELRTDGRRLVRKLTLME